MINYACTVINIDQTDQKSWPIFSDTCHSSRVGVDHAEKVALLARLALEAGTRNLDINQSLNGVSR